MKFSILLLNLMVVPFIKAARVQLLDISPEEAQKLITQQSLDLRYSNKISEAPATGKVYNGKVIDSDDYTEEVYEANQFHGQDGLGRFVFGHADNQQARLEAGNVNGEVRGQYRYIDPWGNDIEVQYWSDSLGFHQSDNRPKFDLQPVTETPEVREAREEHERAWKEAARLNGVDADSNGFYHSENDDDLDGEVSNQQPKYARYPVLSYDKHINSDNAKDFGDVRDDAVIVNAVDGKGTKRGRARFIRQHNAVEEVTSEPRGFFYSFDYPVSYINDHNAAERLSGAPSENVEIFDHLKKDEESIKLRVSGKIAAGLVPEDEVHDVQVNPKQKAVQMLDDQRVSTRISQGILPEDEVHDAQINPKQRVGIYAVEPQGISAKINAGILPEDEVHDVQTNPKQKRLSNRIRDGLAPEDEVHDAQVNPKQRVGIYAVEPQGISAKINAGILPEDEVHDVQTNPKQKVSRSVNRGRGSIKFKDTINIRQ